VDILQKHTNYRADIDGLRAIAILSVIGYHFSPNFLKGGFIGVDIFFVISGFLISSNIYSDLNSNSFSFTDFYRRRIIRIFPALLVVLFVCYVFGWFALLGQEYAQLGKHIASGAAFIANLTLWSEAGYFDNFADQKILLHLWSLGVEEQFYIFWPFAIWIISKRRMSIGSFILTTLLISFIWCFYESANNSVAAFYSPLCRFWELLVGAGAAYYSHSVIPRQIKNTGLTPSDFWSFAGLTLITVSIFTINKSSIFPGWLAILPTLGTAMIILAGPASIVNRFILSRYVLVWIGLISYPLYLWHWPLLAYARVVGGYTPSYTAKLALLFVTFILAWLTYKLVELPIKKFKKASTILTLSMIFFAAIGIITFANDGFIFREENYTKISRAIDASAYPGSLKVLKIDDKSYGLGYQKSNLTSTTLFIGDSNVEHYYARVDQLIKDHPNSVNSAIFQIQFGCAPIEGFVDPSEKYKCSMKKISEILKAEKNINTVVIGASWFKHLSGGSFIHSGGSSLPIYRGSAGYELALRQLKDFIAQLRNNNNKKVYLLLNIPMGESLDPRNMAKRSFSSFPKMISVSPGSVSKVELIDRYGYIREDLIKLAIALDVAYIDPIEYLCDLEICHGISSDGDPIYRDKDHLNSYFVRHGTLFIDQVMKSQ
jgi:peptidoglycan/LPS O-acetylase OafA/YrhL